jgi:cobalt transporter subunit CbtB
MRSSATLTIGAGRAPRTATRAQDATAALLAAMLGVFLVWGVGFSHISVVHNAAHDVRHSAGFPCH